MAFNRPTLSELKDRIRADVDNRLLGAHARLRHTVLGKLAEAIAGAVYLIHGHLVWESKQIHPDTADGEHLDRHGDLRDISRKAATKSNGNIIITGTNGTDIPAGTEVQRADGVAFITDALATIAAGTATVAVTAVVAGVNGVTLAGVTVTLSSPLAGINSNATVDAGGLTGGADIESDDAYRIRVTERWRKPTQGGNKNDYITWAQDVAGVTRSWCYPLENGAGTVVVRFMMDDVYPSDGIPQPGDVTTVQAYLNSLRPATANVDVQAPIAKAIAMTIAITPDTAQIRADVEAEIKDLFRRRAEPGGTIYLSQINEAISIAQDEEDHTLTIPAADVTSLPSEIPVVGVITWA